MAMDLRPGSIGIYNTSGTSVFSVSAAGVVAIASTLAVTGAATFTSTVACAGLTDSLAVVVKGSSTLVNGTKAIATGLSACTCAVATVNGSGGAAAIEAAFDGTTLTFDDGSGTSESSFYYHIIGTE